MRMITVSLALFFIALLPIKCQASNPAQCGKDTDVHKALNAEGFFSFMYTVTDHDFFMEIWLNGDGNYIMTAEADGKACILTTGKTLWFTKAQKI
jgi:hypothetical protein